MIFEHGDRIVFAGDSVTDMGSACPVGDQGGENLGRSYVRIIDNMLAAWYPERIIAILNAGISGNTSRDLLARWDRDILGCSPMWVSICIGINDVWRQFDMPAYPQCAVAPDDYAANVEKMVVSAKERCKGVFLMTPYIMEPCREDRMRGENGRIRQHLPRDRKEALGHSCRYPEGIRRLLPVPSLSLHCMGQDTPESGWRNGDRARIPLALRLRLQS